MRNQVRAKLREILQAQQASEIVAAPRCLACDRPLGRFVPTRLTVWQPRGDGAYETAGLQTDADLDLCTCTPHEEATR